MATFRAPIGTKDILPDNVWQWQEIETTARRIFTLYDYKEIRTPIFEHKSLFERSIGEATDIVEKQMYTFKDRGGRDFALRPEATVSVARAYIENGMQSEPGVAKLYYSGAMFRAERPQAGRSRQFHQIGAEAIGSYSPYLEAETIALLNHIVSAIGLREYKIKINSLGCGKDKEKLSKVLRDKLSAKKGELCEDCGRRLDRNVFRVLDCKNPDCKAVVKEIFFDIGESLCPECAERFLIVREILKKLGVEVAQDISLVRGLDYYTGIVFEMISSSLGAQDAIAAGGRYDGLVKEIGGRDTGAIGFALGVERLIMAINAAKIELNLSPSISVYMAVTDKEFYKEAFSLVDVLRKTGVSACMDYEDRSLKAQMRTANRLNARWTVILGEEESKQGMVILRDMETGEQREVEKERLVEEIQSLPQRHKGTKIY